jgi:hypothetical protein
MSQRSHRDNESWPLALVMELDREHRSYRPKSDFLISKSSVPRLLVEVHSGPFHAQPFQPDCIRMLLQGSAVVRFANTFIEAFKPEKNFVLVAIYIDNQGEVKFYIIFQDRDYRDTNDLTSKHRVRYILCSKKFEN